jgi:hypothetical protein
MSSYNENLNTGVVASLQAQELKLNSTQAQLNAAMFTLYYAEDAKITAAEKLDKTEGIYQAQEVIKEEAVDDNNMAVNLLATANQEKLYTTQSITNTAVAAANVQIATNAIVGLASDMGSIVSILNAADYGSQIYQQALSVNVLMNDTAYNAEVTSQLAMEASSLTAEITASTVADMASSTTASVTSLLTALSAQLDATSAMQVADNNALVTASVAEKQAQGLLEDTKVDYNAAESAYFLSTAELNLDLSVTGTTINNETDTFLVEFLPYENPFKDVNTTIPEATIFKKSPVKDYYIIVVKETEKSIFSLATAEGIINTTGKVLEIDGNQEGKISRKIGLNDMLDSNGNPLALGVNYVVFVMAQFELDYKKALNNFEDYLTAPSSPFMLTSKLNSPEHADIKVDTDDSKNLTLKFSLVANTGSTVEYRCMFLPDNSVSKKGLTTVNGLEHLDIQIVEETEIEYKNQLIIEKQEEINININILNNTKNDLNVNVAEKSRTPKLDLVKQKLEQKIEKVQEAINELQKKINETTQELAAKQKNINSNLQYNKNKVPKPGFFFNKLIAENVTEGNYYVPGDEGKTLNGKTNIILPIKENTTDNFGNPLAEGKKYIPVVLSYATGLKAIEFSNSISDFQHTNTFTYSSNK